MYHIVKFSTHLGRDSSLLKRPTARVSHSMCALDTTVATRTHNKRCIVVNATLQDEIGCRATGMQCHTNVKVAVEVV